MHKEEVRHGSNSLFEDNAEFGYGMFLANRAIRDGLKLKVERLLEASVSPEINAACQEYLDTFAQSSTNTKASDNLIELLKV